MSVTVVLTLKAKPGTYADLAATMAAILPDTAARDGAELIRAAGDPETETVIVHEIWDRIESQQTYLAWRAERGDLETLGRMLREPPKFDTLATIF